MAQEEMEIGELPDFSFYLESFATRASPQKIESCHMLTTFLNEF
jgi:hypothetical protein